MHMYKIHCTLKQFIKKEIKSVYKCTGYEILCGIKIICKDRGFYEMDNQITNSCMCTVPL